MGKAKDIIETKGNFTLSITSDTMVFDALRLMSENNVGALLVIDQEKLVGIFSERDYARKVILKGRNSLDTQVSEIMSKDVVTVSPNDSMEQCMNLMTDKRIRHLPVVQSNKVLGVISIGDVVKFIIEEKENVIDHLKLYMSGA